MYNIVTIAKNTFLNHHTKNQNIEELAQLGHLPGHIATMEIGQDFPQKVYKTNEKLLTTNNRRHVMVLLESVKMY